MKPCAKCGISFWREDAGDGTLCTGCEAVARLGRPELPPELKELYEFLLTPLMGGSIWTYPTIAEDNQRRLYEACNRLEELGLLTSKPLPGSTDVIIFTVLED